MTSPLEPTRGPAPLPDLEPAPRSYEDHVEARAIDGMTARCHCCETRATEGEPLTRCPGCGAYFCGALECPEDRDFDTNRKHESWMHARDVPVDL